MKKKEIQFTVDNYLNSHVALFKKLNESQLSNGIKLILEKYRGGSKIITCGNGGSAYTASHYITDWNKMVNLTTGNKFHGYSLCDNIGLITAFGNDLSYDEIFSGQLKSIMNKEDLLIVVSGSGNSPNILKAIEYSNSIGADSLAIVGYDGGEAIKIAKYNIHIPSFDMQLCEDLHLMFGHMVMKELCGYSIKN
jgi:D-sedoheptulose 7-phosphate isomerase